MVRITACRMKTLEWIRPCLRALGNSLRKYGKLMKTARSESTISQRLSVSHLVFSPPLLIWGADRVNEAAWLPSSLEGMETPPIQTITLAVLRADQEYSAFPASRLPFLSNCTFLLLSRNVSESNCKHSSQEGTTVWSLRPRKDSECTKGRQEMGNLYIPVLSPGG